MPDPALEIAHQFFAARFALCAVEQFAQLVAQGTRLVVIDGGDHSFTLPKSSGQTLDTTLAHVADEVARFIASR